MLINISHFLMLNVFLLSKKALNKDCSTFPGVPLEWWHQPMFTNICKLWKERYGIDHRWYVKKEESREYDVSCEKTMILIKGALVFDLFWFDFNCFVLVCSARNVSDIAEKLYSAGYMFNIIFLFGFWKQFHKKKLLVLVQSHNYNKVWQCCPAT